MSAFLVISSPFFSQEMHSGGTLLSYFPACLQKVST